MFSMFAYLKHSEMKSPEFLLPDLTPVHVEWTTNRYDEIEITEVYRFDETGAIDYTENILAETYDCHEAWIEDINKSLIISCENDLPFIQWVASYRRR